MTDFNIMDYFN